MPTIEEAIGALAAKLHPNYLSVKVTHRKQINDRTEHIVIVHEFGKQFEYKADTLDLMKADLKNRLIAKQKDTTNG